MITESQEIITMFRDERGNVKGFILTEPAELGSEDRMYTSFTFCGGGQPFAWFEEGEDGAKILAGIREELKV